jgi:hemoglobin
MKQLITATALTLLGAMSGACIAQSLPAASPASAYPVAPAPGLYQAFGEQAGIRSLMDDFVQRLKADARIGQPCRDTNPAQLAGSLTDQVCQLAGGPCTYKGPDMKTAHADMGITRADFNALVEVLQASMNAKGIPFARQNPMLALLAPMHRDVIAPRP